MKKIIIVLILLASIGVSAKTMIATVNGYPIDKKEADVFLKIATNGKVKYHMLNKEDKIELIKSLAMDKLVLKTAMKEISKKEQQNIIAGFWLRKKALNYKVSNKEIKDAYNKNKQYFKDKKGNTIPFDKAKEVIKRSISQKKALQKIMQKAKIMMDGKIISTSKVAQKHK